jgi:hypothetical protein
VTTRHHAYALAAALAFLSAPAALAQQTSSTVEVKGLRDASKLFRVESQHFIVYSDSRSDEVVELINNLERLDFLLRLYTKPFVVGQAGAPKVTLYFQDRVSWTPALGRRPADAIGLFNSCASGVQAFAFNVEPLAEIKDAELAKGSLNEGLSYIFEAYARHFLYRHTDIRAPESFIDGFAQYFSSVRFSDKQLVVGRWPTGVGRYLNHIDDGNIYELTFDHVLGAEKMRKPDSPAAQLEYQARSWNLMHFMLSSDANRAKMTQYLNLVNEGAVPAKAFAAAYGLEGEALNTAMWRYRLTGAKVVRVDVPDLPRAQMDFASMTGAAGEFLLADATLKACPSREEGEALLRRLTADAAKVPGVDFAQLTLARAQIDWGNPRDALAWLGGAARRDSGNVEVHYLLGLANLKLAERGADGERERLLAAARHSLAQAAAIKPGRPDVSFALYRAELLGAAAPAKTGVARAIVAWRHAHEVPAFARSAALAYAWMGDAVGASRALGILANNRRDPDNADWAADWLKKLGKGVPRAELMTAMRKEATLDPVFKEWTIAHQDVVSAVKAKASMDKARAVLDSMMMGDPSKPETMDQRVPSK